MSCQSHFSTFLSLSCQDDDFQIEEEDDDEPTNAGMKQARKNDQYTLCIKFGLAGIATRFGLSAEQVRF